MEAIVLKEALSLVFVEAKKFFEASTIKFINDDEKHYYGLSIIIDDYVKGIEKITPFKYKMSRDTLAGLYTALVKNGGKNSIQKMIVCLNKAIIDGYFRGGPSWAIETLKNNHREDITVDAVIKMFISIIADAIGTSTTTRNNGGLYRLLGGEEECYLFFTEVLQYIEDGIPELEDIFSVPKIHHLPRIPCYTCKYSKVENGVRRCTKYKHLVTPELYAENPEKWIDGEFSNDCGGFVSAIIDERCSKCDTYECRIKQRTSK